MIIWLASYPKSGNTFLRSLLSSYFFSKDNTFSFELLNNIKQYPHRDYFLPLGIDINNPHTVAKNHLKAQKNINKNKKSFKFFKTHSGFVKMDGFSFTDLNNSLGVIYIVRDPRDVVISYAKHNDEPIETTLKKINENYLINNEVKDEVPVYVGSWSFHYNSWKQFKGIKKYLLIKYEDLVQEKEFNFKKILEFIKNLTKSDFEITDSRIKKTIKETEFEKLEKLEEKFGFKESPKNKKGQRNKFFRKGEINQWHGTLDTKIISSIEKVCEKERIELGYL